MVVVRPATWGEVAEQLKPSLQHDGDYIKADVENGLAFCWWVGDVAMISRREGDEMVIVCMVGKQLFDVAPVIVAAAKKAGCKSLRFHTQRPAFGKLLAPLGFFELERVYRVEL